MKPNRSSPTFWRRVLLPFSWYKSRPSMVLIQKRGAGEGFLSEPMGINRRMNLTTLRKEELVLVLLP
jgi:hypothetical protein